MSRTDSHRDLIESAISSARPSIVSGGASARRSSVVLGMQPPDDDDDSADFMDEKEEEVHTTKAPPALMRTESLDTCSVCWDAMRTDVNLPCGHNKFCDACLVKMKKCPICRKPYRNAVLCAICAHQSFSYFKVESGPCNDTACFVCGEPSGISDRFECETCHGVVCEPCRKKINPSSIEKLCDYPFYWYIAGSADHPPELLQLYYSLGMNLQPTMNPDGTVTFGNLTLLDYDGLYGNFRKPNGEVAKWVLSSPPAFLLVLQMCMDKLVQKMKEGIFEEHIMNSLIKSPRLIEVRKQDDVFLAFIRFLVEFFEENTEEPSKQEIVVKILQGLADWVCGKTNFVLGKMHMHQICQKYLKLSQWEGFANTENKENALIYKLGLALVKIANNDIAIGIANKLYKMCKCERLAVRIIHILGFIHETHHPAREFAETCGLQTDAITIEIVRVYQHFEVRQRWVEKTMKELHEKNPENPEYTILYARSRASLGEFSSAFELIRALNVEDKLLAEERLILGGQILIELYNFDQGFRYISEVREVGIYYTSRARLALAELFLHFHLEAETKQLIQELQFDVLSRHHTNTYEILKINADLQDKTSPLPVEQARERLSKLNHLRQAQVHMLNVEFSVKNYEAAFKLFREMLEKYGTDEIYDLFVDSFTSTSVGFIKPCNAELGLSVLRDNLKNEALTHSTRHVINFHYASTAPRLTNDVCLQDTVEVYKGILKNASSNRSLNYLTGLAIMDAYADLCDYDAAIKAVDLVIENETEITRTHGVALLGKCLFVFNHHPETADEMLKQCEELEQKWKDSSDEFFAKFLAICKSYFTEELKEATETLKTIHRDYGDLVGTVTNRLCYLQREFFGDVEGAFLLCFENLLNVDDYLTDCSCIFDYLSILYYFYDYKGIDRILNTIMKDHVSKKVNLYEHELVHCKYYQLRIAIEMGEWEKSVKRGSDILENHSKYIHSNIAEFGSVYLQVAFAKQKLGETVDWGEIAKQTDLGSKKWVDALILAGKGQTEESWEIVKGTPFKRSNPPMSRLVIDLIFEFAIADRFDLSETLISRFEYLYLGEEKTGFQAVASLIRSSFVDCPQIWEFVRKQPRKGFNDIELKMLDLAKAFVQVEKREKDAASILQHLLSHGVFGVRYVIGFMQDIGQIWDPKVIDRVIAGDPTYEPYWRLITDQSMPLDKLRNIHKKEPKIWKQILLETPVHIPIPEPFLDALGKIQEKDTQKTSSVELIIRFLQETANFNVRENLEAGSEVNITSALTDVAANFNRILDSGRNHLAGIADTIVPSRPDEVFTIARARNVLNEALSSISASSARLRSSVERAAAPDAVSTEAAGEDGEASDPANRQRSLVRVFNGFISGLRNNLPNRRNTSRESEPSENTGAERS